jgi:hypothetical protein
MCERPDEPPEPLAGTFLHDLWNVNQAWRGLVAVATPAWLTRFVAWLERRLTNGKNT